MMSYDLRSFVRFAPKLKLEGMPPLVLEPFQHQVLQDHFGPAIELVTIIPKKNYKTTTLAALAVFHVREVEDAEVPVLASTREQAGVLYRQAEKMIRRSGEKDGRRKDVYHLDGFTYEVRPGYKEIRCVETRGLIKVLPAEAGAVDGIIPTLALVDELHRHPNGELYGVLSDGLGARDGRMVTISTAGSDEGSTLGLMRQGFRELDGMKKGRHLRVQDGSDVFHEWALDPEDDPENLRDVKRANPAKAMTIAKLRRRQQSKGMTVGRWLRFACGIWTAGEEPEIQAKDWDPLKVDIGQIQPRERVVLVPSVGHNAAIALVAPRPEGRVACKVEVIEAEENRSIYVKTEDRILELCQSYDAEIHAPGVGFIRSRELLADKRLAVVEAPQSVAALSAATGTFNRMLRAGLLMHDGDPILRSHALSATMKTNEAGERYEVTDRARGLIALVMAVHGVTEMGEPTPKIHVYKGA
jgi:phage terminase large subunit-like protein